MNRNIICVALAGFASIILPIGESPQAQLSESAANACMERVTYGIAGNQDWLSDAQIHKVADGIQRECGIPKKNFYMVMCANEGKFCALAGDFIPEPNFDPKPPKKKPIQKPKPVKAPTPTPPSPKPEPIKAPTPAPSSSKPKPAPTPKEVKVIKDAPPPQIIKEIHHKTTVINNTVDIDIPKHVQSSLDGNLDYILNNTCKFVSQSPAFIDSNQELAMQCAQLWAMIKNVRSK